MQTGILDKTRLTANLLMLVLVGLNIFFSVQYTQNMKIDDANKAQESQKTEERLKVSKFMKLFVDKVLGTNGTISFEDRVKLEADIRALGDESAVKQWDMFVASKDSETAQKNAVLLMSILMNKMII
jgi:ABC-type maltose transport system permease subunit